MKRFLILAAFLEISLSLVMSATADDATPRVELLPRVASAAETGDRSANSEPDEADASQDDSAGTEKKYAKDEERLTQPESVVPAISEPLPPIDSPQVTINELIQSALSANPSVAQAADRVAALRGKHLQAGLPPNPSVGFLGTELGNEGKGGQNGGFAGQEFVTAGKLRLDQAVVAQEIQRAEQQLAATQTRVVTDVRQSAYHVLVAQRRVELATELVRISDQAVNASKELRDAEEIPLAALLQTEVEQQNATILLQTARNQLDAAWQGLSAVLGAEWPRQSIAGDVAQLPDALNWDEQLVRITAQSPELGAAMTDILRAQTALRRATVEPIPNITATASAQYDDNSNYTIGGLQIGVPLPLWNRNQGGIRQAQAEVAYARRNADRVELDLKRRLAEAFQQYANARAQATTYAGSILPKARQTIELVQRGYQLGEVGYLDLLAAQRTFSQTNLAYLDSLSSLWNSWAKIDGLLLTGSLETNPD
jgi:cobalt-zinc-cadmium efflux system outer membrane protein